MAEEQEDNDQHESKPLDLRVLKSEKLLAGSRSVMIRHDDEIYRLTVTRNGKLILQK